MNTVFFRAVAVWLLIIVAESIHGTLRELLLKPYAGDLRARQIALFTGMLIILCVAYAFIRWIRAATTRALLLVGLLWVALTLAFEFGLGLFVLGYSWERMIEDYDFTRGGFLSFGMIVLWLSPLIATKLHAGPMK
ncbi:MAG: hypothetical protein ACKV2V_17470 [Blastocatellia bacterium]